MQNRTILPILFNLICNFIYWWNSQLVFYYLGFDQKVVGNKVKYKFGAGSASLLVTGLLLLISMIWILINTRLIYKEKKKCWGYFIVAMGLVLFMGVCWGVYYLDVFPLRFEILTEQPPRL